MDKLPKKIIYWSPVLLVYTLMVVVVMRMLLSPDYESASSLPVGYSAVSGEHAEVNQLIDMLGRSGGFEGVLLPLGPGESPLPGNPDIWKDYQRARPHYQTTVDNGGFDALQAVSDVSNLGVGAVSELFLSEEPLLVFRRGEMLYLLSARMRVQVIDCKTPKKPRLAKTLPYVNVISMAMQGTFAYLLVERTDIAKKVIIAVDLHNPEKPRELSRYEVSENTYSLFFINSQLVVYSWKRGLKGQQSVALYDVEDRSRLKLLGRAKSPRLGLRQHFYQYDQYLLAPGPSGGLAVYDFSQPLTPELTSFVETPALDNLASHGDMLFATGVHGGLYSFDFHDPLQPVLSTVSEEEKYSAYFLEYDNYSYMFSMNGFLRVFDVSPGEAQLTKRHATKITGELVFLPGKGLIKLGQPPVEELKGVAGGLPWPEELEIVDSLALQDAFILLDEEGRLSFYRGGEDHLPNFRYALQLTEPQRWLAAFDGYLYVGGESSISIVDMTGDQPPTLLRQIELPVTGSWDGLVMQKTLYVAAGKDGLLTYTLLRPGFPSGASVWSAPRHLQSEIDVRQLSAADDGRIFLAAGNAGLFSGRMGAGGVFKLEGAFRLASSVNNIMVHNGLALVATDTKIHVLDIRDSHAFQNLGKIRFPGVEKLMVAAPDLFAGYAAETGWSLLSLPRILSSGDTALMHETCLPQHLAGCDFRIHLFDEFEVKGSTGLVHTSSRLIDKASSGRALVH